MARGADLEEDAILPLEGDFAVVQPAGGVHQAESLNELFGIEAFEAAGCIGRRVNG